MNQEQFNQYMKTLDEIKNLFKICNTPYLDLITDMLNDEQYNQLKNHPAINVLQI